MEVSNFFLSKCFTRLTMSEWSIQPPISGHLRLVPRDVPTEGYTATAFLFKVLVPRAFTLENGSSPESGCIKGPEARYFCCSGVFIIFKYQKFAGLTLISNK